jgi:hypothetical protein
MTLFPRSERIPEFAAHPTFDPHPVEFLLPGT